MAQPTLNQSWGAEAFEKKVSKSLWSPVAIVAPSFSPCCVVASPLNRIIPKKEPLVLPGSLNNWGSTWYLQKNVTHQADVPRL